MPQYWLIFMVLSLLSASSIRNLLETKYPSLIGGYEGFDLNLKSFLWINRVEIDEFLNFIDSLDSGGEVDENHNLVDNLIYSFLPDYLTCQISKEIFEKLFERNLLVLKLAISSIFFDQQNAFDRLFLKYRAIIQEYELRAPVSDSQRTLSESILSRTALFKYAVQMINSGFQFKQPALFVTSICGLVGPIVGERQFYKDFIRFLVVQNSLVDSEDVSDIKGLLDEVLQENFLYLK